jgi:RimJ/RimL family protein N-acetyltransferase
MTAAPHMRAIPGPAADFGGALRARLPRIETERCILRAPVLEDAPAWQAIMVPDAKGHLGGPYTADEAFTEFAATVGLWLLRGHGLWTVTDRAGAVLGFVLIGFEPGDPAPELGWLFLPEAQGKGLAAEAAAAARAQGFGPMGLPELISCIDPANAPSRRLAERLGARRDGTVADPATGAPADLWRHAPGSSAEPSPVPSPESA